jgi:minor extracellular serine protease Vpr
MNMFVRKLIGEIRSPLRTLAIIGFALTSAHVRADPLAQTEARADAARAAFGVSGRGVLVVVADRGIDWRNNDFRNADGSTRIAGIFDLSASSGSNPYGVGTVYTREQINSALSGGPALAHRDAVGHGTATASGCCGNGRNSSGKYQGFAPEATIAAIKIVSEGAPAVGAFPAEAPLNRIDKMPEAIRYAKDLGAQLGMPVVMIWNFGSIGGPTDGTSALAKLIDANAGAGKPGFVIVTGTGDDGGADNHAQGSVGATAFDLQIQKGARNASTPLNLSLWYSGAPVEVTLLGPSGTFGPYPAPAANGFINQVAGGLTYWQIGPNGTPFSGNNPNGKGNITLTIPGAAGTYTLRMRALTGTTTFHAALNPARTIGPASDDSKFLTAVGPGYSIWDAATAQSNIAPNDYLFKNIGNQKAGELWRGSSVGPTYDERLGVDLSAPGEGYVVACGENSFWSTSVCTVPDGGGKYVLFGAVSGAAPLVTGSIALLLQKNPALDAAQVKSILQQSARRDSFTGSAPNPRWGYGKLDVYAAMSAIASPALSEITVFEFYNQPLDHFFRTANPGEASVIDSGGAGAGWSRTGDNFVAYGKSGYPAGAVGVCRFFGSLSPGPNSHFYTADAGECQGLKDLQARTPATEKRWNYEEIAFGADLPSSGACPARAPLPIYRVYNNGARLGIDSNHRYTTSLTEYNALIAKGWGGEGVVMCGIRK